VFIEKDYWITLVLKRLSESDYVESAVFKGGTSLLKGYKLIERFSEDLDIAIINVPGLTGNKIKNLIRKLEKEISPDLTEIENSPLASKGSRFRKTVFSYPKTGDVRFYQGISDKLVIEINSFANPFPFKKCEINSFIGLSLALNSQKNLIEKYGLTPFIVNVLDKRQTLVEKLVSLFRSSFDNDPITSITGKIRHFYDLYYLYMDKECRDFVESDKFQLTFNDIWNHDQEVFDEPIEWQEKPFTQSSLIMQFRDIWSLIKLNYTKEISTLAFSEIPNESLVADAFIKICMKLPELPDAII
jgi:hypothetical protein